RDRLLLRDDLVWPKPLTLVMAPAGYGKTVLLTQWAARQRRRRVRWVTLTPAHNDPRRLMDDLWQSLVPAESGRPGSAPAAQPRAVVADLTTLSGVLPTTLVLDDFDVLTDGRGLEICAALAEDAPSWLHLVLMGRAKPALASYRAGLSDRLVELGHTDLAFSAEEAADLLQRSTALGIDRPSAEALVARTEGWPAGLQIAARGIAADDDADAYIHAFDGTDPEVARYFAEHVLPGLSDDELRFLTGTSVLERMSGPSCDHVTGDHQGQAMLEALERRSVFTVRTPHDHASFRYHRLFRASLRQLLRERGRDREQPLLRRAAEWYLQRHEVDLGIDYLAEAGAWDDLVSQVLAHSGAMLERQQSAHVVAWVARIDPAVKAGRTDVLLLEATAMALSGLTAGLDRTVEALNAHHLSRADRLVADLAVCYATLSAGLDDEAAATADRVLLASRTIGEFEVPRWLGLVGSTSDVVAAARVARAVSQLAEGRIADAKRDLQAVPDEARAPWRSSALGLLAVGEALRGRLATAEDLVNRALALGADFDVRPSTLAVARLAAALVATERDELDRGSALLAEAGASLTGTRWPVLAAWILTERAHLALCEGAIEHALAILVETEGAADAAENGRTAEAGAARMPLLVRSRRAMVEARAHLATGDLRSAAAVLEPVRDAGTSEIFGARSRLAVESGDIDAARALVRRWPDDPEPRARLERCLWSAVVHSSEGDRASALAVLGAVVAECEIEHIVGLFRDAGPAALGLARALYGVAPTAFLRQVVERPLPVARPKRAKGLVVPLTEKEYTVLSLLPTRMSNTEIAERLGISHNTVKTHLKHIYRKFNAVRRSEVISVAERLHML
ncbi:MAG TPA: LuxR C-terminal-related transcriptional regulator, partial [Acidimicrobiales bacterium]|nr:LuxR C-terminal-related transcriptional regulator [Acidimicrobiales bacterium]